MTFNLTSNCYAHWKLNESQGNIAYDDSGNSRNLTLNNMNNDNWKVVSGKLNGALHFGINGNNEYVTANIADFDKDDSWSTECWVKLDYAALSGNGYIMSRYGLSAGVWKGGWLFYIVNRKLYFELEADGTYIIVSSTSEVLANTEWNHLVATYDGSADASGVSLYVNGDKIATTTVTNNLVGSIDNAGISQPFNLGHAMNGTYGASHQLSGKLDECVIYDKVLSASEVKERYNDGFGTEYLETTRESFDPRKSIRSIIGTSRYDIKERKTIYTIDVTNDYGDDIYVPMYISEDMTSDFIPEMPFIEILKINTTYDPHNPGASIREMRCYFQFNIYFTNQDGITPSTFLKDIKDKLQDVTRANQKDVSGTWYFSITNERHEKEDNGKTVTHVCYVEAYAIYTDRC